MTKHQDEWQAVGESVYDMLSEGLDELAWMNIPFNKNLELALLELTSRELRLNGRVFEVWLKEWHRHKVVMETSVRNIDQNLRICNEEKTVSMTRNLLKKARQDQTPLNLRQVVDPVCVNPRHISIAANKMRKRVAEPMGELMVWDVSCDTRDVQGKEQPREWRIGVGPALFWFQKFVYIPLRGRQVRAFIDKHGGELE